MTDEALSEYLRLQAGLPRQRCTLKARTTGRIELDDMVIERIVYDAEPGSSVPANLYVPRQMSRPAPAMVMACGHGGSKSAFYNQYAGQLYAKAGLVTLAADPLGEEERDADGTLGTHAHDRVAMDAQRLGRPVIGKMAWDLMRGIDYLHERADIVDPERIGVAGHSLGGSLTAYTAALDERVHLALAVGMHFHPSEHPLWTNCPCIIGMHFLIMSRISYAQLLGLAAPRCATLLMLGDDDPIIGGAAVFNRGHQETFEAAARLYAEAGAAKLFSRQVYEGAGHRPFFLNVEALLWIERRFGLPRLSREEVLELPTLLMADWAWENGVIFEQHYGTLQHYAGTVVPDVGAHALAPYQLACLSRDERRSAEFSIDAWMAQVAETVRTGPA